MHETRSLRTLPRARSTPAWNPRSKASQIASGEVSPEALRERLERELREEVEPPRREPRDDGVRGGPEARGGPARPPRGLGLDLLDQSLLEEAGEGVVERDAVEVDVPGEFRDRPFPPGQRVEDPKADRAPQGGERPGSPRRVGGPDPHTPSAFLCR